MGYFMASGKWADTRDMGTLSSGAVTATVTGTGIELGYRTTLRLDLTVSAVSGTSPTLDVAVQTSKDNSTWRAVAAFTQATAAGTERKSFTGLDRFVRIVETLGGSATPTVTRTITGEAI